MEIVQQHIFRSGTNLNIWLFHFCQAQPNLSPSILSFISLSVHMLFTWRSCVTVHMNSGSVSVHLYCVSRLSSRLLKGFVDNSANGGEKERKTYTRQTGVSIESVPDKKCVGKKGFGEKKNQIVALMRHIFLLLWLNL